MRYNTKYALVGILFVVPAIAWFAIFRLYPIFQVVYISLHNWRLLTTYRPYIGVENYINAFKDPIFLQSIVNTFYFAALFLVFRVLISFGLALMVVSIQNKYVKTYVRGALFFPVLTSMVAVAIAWIWMYQPTYGVLNYFLKSLGLSPINWLLDRNLVIPCIALTSIWKTLGFTLLIFCAGLESIPVVYYEAAKLDGAGKSQIFFRVTLPLLRPVMLFVFVTTLIESLRVFTQVYVMSGGGPGTASITMSLWLYQNAFMFFQMGYGSSLSVILFGICLILTYAQFKFLTKELQY
jgi:ABC-type sugar transport system permease subunit